MIAVTPQLAMPGDLVFAHSKNLIGRVIRFGEWLRFRPGSKWNHVAIVSKIENGKTFIIQAEASGVTNDKELDTIAPGGQYLVVEPPQGVDKDQLLEFANAQVGSKYGWLSILTVAIDIITPGWAPSLRRRNSWICSAVVGEALRFSGWLHHWNDIYTVVPSELYAALYGEHA